MAALVEHDLAIDQCKQCPIAAGADVLTRNELRPALPNQDAPGGDMFAAKSLHAQALADAVASVTNAALTFLVCHN